MAAYHANDIQALDNLVFRKADPRNLPVIGIVPLEMSFSKATKTT